MKKIFLVILIISLFVVGCAPEDVMVDEPTEVMEEKAEQAMKETDKAMEGESVEAMKEASWLDIELTDVNTDTTFKISDYSGKKVLIESFAVWCPLCTRQQRNIKSLHEEIGDEIISVSIDTDPNEDAELVKNHAQANGFDWAYVVAPREFTLSLIDQFGNSVVNAPSAPVILVCEDGSSRKMPSGVKSVDKLKNEIAKGC